jgi:hypothetical protein
VKDNRQPAPISSALLSSLGPARRNAAFNGERHACTQEWFQEISAQPITILEAQLTQSFDPIQTELPPEIPILRIWGRHDRDGWGHTTG